MEWPREVGGKMIIKSVIYAMIYFLLFVWLTFVFVEWKDEINKAELTQTIEPQIIYGVVEGLKK